jgi:XRE family transcriptional regulator, aerobic/anaerobic benzoate catabolism transcriptional regulator
MAQSAEDTAFLQMLGHKIRLLRTRRGMTRRILALRSGVSERYISAVEAGTGNGSILLLRALSVALHVDLV